MAMTTYGTISQRTAAWVATKMLDHARPVLVLSKFGQHKPIPKNTADNVKFRRPVPFALATQPLVEGVTPTAQQMLYEDVPARLEQYGAVVVVTDKIVDTVEDPVLSDASELCGEQAAETLEYITWGAIRAGTAVIFANGSQRSDVNTRLALSHLRLATRVLKEQRTRPPNKMLTGGPNYNTRPVEGGWVAFAHTHAENDIRDLPKFTPVAEYGSMKPLCPEEIGACENNRFILSPVLDAFVGAGSASLNGMFSVGGSNVDVYPILIAGKDSYGLVPLSGKGTITPSVISPETKTKDDPLGQRGYVGWKTYFVALILNEAWIHRIEVGVTDL